MFRRLRGAAVIDHDATHDNGDQRHEVSGAAEPHGDSAARDSQESIVDKVGGVEEIAAGFTAEDGDGAAEEYLISGLVEEEADAVCVGPAIESSGGHGFFLFQCLERAAGEKSFGNLVP